MAKPAKQYITVETSNPEVALKLVGFQILRLPAYCDLNGTRVELPKEALLREDPEKGHVYFESVSLGYRLITHQEALKAMLEGLEGMNWKLVSVALDQNGAEMCVRFRCNASFEISPGDSLQPEIMLGNSYNGSTALAVNLGTYRIKDGVHSLVHSDFRSRWMHLGNQAEPSKMRRAVKEALESYVARVVPTYQSMAQTKLSHGDFVRALISLLKRSVVPKKIGKLALSRALADVDFKRSTMWDLYCDVLLVASQFKGTPGRCAEIKKNIAHAFRDHGKQVLSWAGQVQDDELTAWTLKSR